MRGVVLMAAKTGETPMPKLVFSVTSSLVILVTLVAIWQLGAALLSH
jgi:hypothetical protein